MMHPMSKNKILNMIKIFSEYDFSNGYNSRDSFALLKQYVPIKALVDFGIVTETVVGFEIKHNFNEKCLENTMDIVNSIRLKIEEKNKKEL